MKERKAEDHVLSIKWNHWNSNQTMGNFKFVQKINTSVLIGTTNGSLTCDATVRLSATPPALRLIRKILQSGSSVNFFMAASLAPMDIDPTN